MAWIRMTGGKGGFTKDKLITNGIDNEPITGGITSIGYNQVSYTNSGHLSQESNNLALTLDTNAVNYAFVAGTNNRIDFTGKTTLHIEYSYGTQEHVIRNVPLNNISSGYIAFSVYRGNNVNITGRAYISNQKANVNATGNVYIADLLYESPISLESSRTLKLHNVWIS